MKKTIQELKSSLNSNEQLSLNQLCFLKGGDDGEDIRRKNACGRRGGSGDKDTSKGGNTSTSGSSTRGNRG